MALKHRKGDLIKLAKDGEFDVIVHGNNCFCNWGAGIARSMKLHFPKAHKADKHTRPGDRHKLGTIQVVHCDGVIVVNAFTQYRYGRGLQLNYQALRACMAEVKKQCSGLRIGLPKIGAGHAGGDWKQIKAIIEDVLGDEDVTIVHL